MFKKIVNNTMNLFINGEKKIKTSYEIMRGNVARRINKARNGWQEKRKRTKHVMQKTSKIPNGKKNNGWRAKSGS